MSIHISPTFVSEPKKSISPIIAVAHVVPSALGPPPQRLRLAPTSPHQVLLPRGRGAQPGKRRLRDDADLGRRQTGAQRRAHGLQDPLEQLLLQGATGVLQRPTVSIPVFPTYYDFLRLCLPGIAWVAPCV